MTEGSPDIGGTRASVSQQFAEVLSIAVEDVHPQIGDTDSIGFTSNTGGSSVTFKTGFAAYTAAQDVKQQMISRAARIWEVSEDDVEYEDAVLKHRADDQLQLTFRQLAARQVPTGGPIVGRGGVNPGGAGPAIACHIVDVEVDVDTGKVEILRYTAIQDAGKAIHPSYVEGQIQGGVVQGIGWALNEEYYTNDLGHMVNSSFLDYRMPTSLDLPMIDTCIVEVDNPQSPVWCARRRRSADRSSHGRNRQRHPRCHRRAPGGSSHEPRQRPGGVVGKRRKIASAKPLSHEGRGVGVRAKIYG